MKKALNKFRAFQLLTNNSLELVTLRIIGCKNIVNLLCTHSKPLTLTHLLEK